MYTRIVLGMLMASGDARLRLSGVPLLVAPPPEYRFVPYWRVTPVRPGSIVKVMVPGVIPVLACAIREASAAGTLKVSLPLPMLFTCSLTPAIPRPHVSVGRKIAVYSCRRLG